MLHKPVKSVPLCVQSIARCHITPVNMPDPIQKHFDYGHYGQRTARIGLIVYARSNFPHPFQFSFFNEGMGHTVQNRPGSSLGGLARVWLHSYGLKASWCAGIIWPGFWQDATGLPTSLPLLDWVPFIHRRPG